VWLRDLEVALGERGSPRADEVAIPLTDGERRLVQEARDQSLFRGDEHIGPHHLLLAVLRDTTSSAAQIFIRYGFTHEAALTHLAAVIVKHDHSGSHGHAV
jgi:ATP-dependent Clp protease ATP-binding subunit ClpA